MAKKQRMKAEQETIVTPEFQALYPCLFEPKAMEGSTKKKYGVCAAFQTKETAKSKEEGRPVVDIEPLKALVRNVVIEKFGPDRAKWPPLGDKAGCLKLPFRSGEEPGKKDKPGYGAGITFVDLSKPGDQVRPGVAGPNAGPDGKPELITIPSDVYGGCFMRAKVNAYFWEYMGKSGVSLGIQSVQKLRDDEPLGGGGSNAQEDFDALPTPTGAGPEPVQQPAAGAAVPAKTADLGV